MSTAHEILAAHGLVDVQLDSNPLPSWTSGSATLSPRSHLPVISPTDKRIRFEWCQDPIHFDRFRRRAQLISLDTLPDPSGRSIHSRYTAVKDVVAWWEVASGWWFLTSGTEETEWVKERWEGLNITEESKWCRVCFALVAIVDTLSALQSKHLTLLACKVGSLAFGQRSAYLADFDDVVCLSSFSLPSLLGSNPLARSALFNRDPSDYAPLEDDIYVRKNLRFLSPSAAGSRQVTRQSDIFSFGVLAYELVTGCPPDGKANVDSPSDVDILVDVHKHLIADILPVVDYFQRQADFAAVPARLPPKALSDIIMKCLAKDADDRYGSLAALRYDLKRLGQICLTEGRLDKFIVGDADKRSRFHLPTRPIHRESELRMLSQTWKSVNSVSDSGPHYYETGSTRLVNVWGLSGSGKTRLVQSWARELEKNRKGCLVAECKLDEFSQRPISSFLQIFTCLLDRTLADPEEDPKVWSKKIREALGQQFSVFHAILPTEYRRLLLMGMKPPAVEPIDWANFLPAFKGWSARLLQVFANMSRPLIIIVDDLQWMRPDEIDIWRSLTEGSHPLNHVVIVTLYRVQDFEPPPLSGLLSTAGDSLSISRLPEEGVVSYLEACFPSGLEALATLAQFLFAETAGSPLYLRSLVDTLVKESVIFFDFDILIWRFDPLAVQAHLSDAGVDAYLHRIQATLPSDTAELLRVLSCLSVAGCRVDFLASYLQVSKPHVDAMIAQGEAIGALVTIGSRVRFAHDRQRSTAYNSIPSDQAGDRHLALANTLRQPEYIDDHAFEAADHILAARSLGSAVSDLPATVSLLLTAASRSAFSASFAAGKVYIDAVEVLMNESGGLETWLKSHRQTCFAYAELLSQICGVLSLFDEAYEKLDQLLSLCDTDLERIGIQLLRMRQLIAAARLPEAMSLCWATLEQFGFDPVKPTAHRIRAPQTAKEVKDLVLPADVQTDGPPDEDVEAVVMSMLAHAGPTIFVSQVDRREAAFALGTSLSIAKGLRSPPAAYLVAGYALTCSIEEVQVPCSQLAQRLAQMRPGSWLTSNTLVVTSAIAHRWKNLEDTAEEHTPAYDLSLALGNFELSSYVFAIDLAERRLSKRKHDVDLILARYQAVKDHLSQAGRLFVHIPLQYSLKLLEVSGDTPWVLPGRILPPSDIENIDHLRLHQAICAAMSLRLAVLFDAPLSVQQQMVDDTWHLHPIAIGLCYHVEFAFLAGIIFIRAGSQDPRLKGCMETIRHIARSSHSYALRLEIIECLIALSPFSLDALEDAESLMAKLEEEGEYALAAILNLLVANSIGDSRFGDKLRFGYIFAAFKHFKSAEMPAACHAMKAKYPFCPTPPAEIRFHDIGVVPPTLGRSSTAVSGDTSNSTLNSKDQKAKDSKGEPLDALTLMRSSLVLASEQDPEVLLCTLLRISCQFARADYAAIALCSDGDHAELRLRAAGRSGRILSHDLLISENQGQDVCPAIYMLHVSRSGRPLDKVDEGRVRLDPFYGGKAPRSLLCLPISNRGKQVGIILLSSLSTTSAQLESSNAKEVISALATLAISTTLNYSFTQRLQEEVAQRTEALNTALQAKTAFLSQTSHDLRTPLSAVLGLSAVLEASPGLSQVQREHLRTIILSGEDLLGLINNILDLSRLESQSVSLEHIPFNVRDLVEGALDIVATTAHKKDIEVSLISSIQTDPPELVGDGFRVKQVLMNLLSNAVKFTSNGGVTVHWSHECTADNKCKITMEVRDTGIGIPEGKMNRLFHSFSQVDDSTSRSYGGSGLGLVISRNLAELLGGTCTAASEYGKGSVFTFTFVADTVTQSRSIEYIRFPQSKSCFTLCRPGPWWDMMERNLSVLNCAPVRFADSPDMCLKKGEHDGLNSGVNFDFVLIDTQLVEKEILGKMQKLQPNAKFIYLVRGIDLADAMHTFGITRESIIARPIKFSSLYAAVITADKNGDMPQIPETPTGPTPKKKKVNKNLAKQCPLKILLVDDNAVNVLVGRRILGMLGYDKVDSASDGQQAVEAAEGTRYDLILMDLQMPVLDGFTAMQRIQASPLAGDPAVVILTADAQPEVQARCMAGGAFDHMTKPLNIPKLESVLGSVFTSTQGK